ncbi:type VII toxin-antitoxin system HepT family RNase toxin [Nitratifractor salsuginis]|uniref:DUF86 domain-containing protein n=1 Tax=Nitratifractor salsuginis (strain DSM 16511 / JCM 12458 / E9I37-1) TaxID=749222 RepID=E6WYT8_NITSE|nr:HepT-like ribonuclease domain-containing protein [Nitratifractor salsuginis]ADV46524.1 protein of unknown function DUF86 [Nitratifractor salsuginis DSM 16511]
MRHRIEAKIKRIEYYLELLESYRDDCKERFRSDPMFEGALLHYLYLVSDGAVSLVEMLLKKLKIGRAQSYYEAIDTLGERGIIPREFAYDFAKISSFRNFLAHDYEKIELKRFFGLLKIL